LFVFRLGGLFQRFVNPGTTSFAGTS
jgi:hypothetical protein